MKSKTTFISVLLLTLLLMSCASRHVATGHEKTVQLHVPGCV